MTDIKALALQCRDAATAIASLPTEAKNALLRAMAEALVADEAVILAANARDLDAASAKGIGSAMRDRLRAYGLFAEIISWKLRFFVPVDATGPAILAKVLECYPIARIADRWRMQVEAFADGAPALQRLLAAARNADVLRPGESVATDVDPVSLM